MLAELSFEDTRRLVNLLKNHEVNRVSFLIAREAPLAQIVAWRDEVRLWAVNFIVATPLQSVNEFKLFVAQWWPRCAASHASATMFANHFQQLPVGRVLPDMNTPDAEETELCSECKYLFRSHKNEGYYILNLEGKTLTNISHSCMLN